MLANKRSIPRAQSPGMGAGPTKAGVHSLLLLSFRGEHQVEENIKACALFPASALSGFWPEPVGSLETAVAGTWASEVNGAIPQM
jgi:hypothetical protein